jgi:hypothetical protein
MYHGCQEMVYTMQPNVVWQQPAHKHLQCTDNMWNGAVNELWQNCVLVESVEQNPRQVMSDLIGKHDDCLNHMEGVACEG